jgi:uroporphyrinogen decarboxylase
MNASNLFQSAIARKNHGRPPVWFMRQAGRYHSHYQALRKKNSFIDLCKKPEVACEAAMGPINDFDFDAAILFSDLLFPLEVMGMGLTYDPGPKLSRRLEKLDDVRRLRGGTALADQLAFQAEAVSLIRRRLPQSKGLLGFVGGPLTLFFYAVEGSHKGELKSAHAGMSDGRYAAFTEKLIPLLAENMAAQAKAGADTVAVLDTCAGELSPDDFAKYVIPSLAQLFKLFQAICPNKPISYYSKGTGPAHWDHLKTLPISYMGFDWNTSLPETLSQYSDRFAIQGNVDPHWLFLPASELEKKLREVFEKVHALPAECRKGWICGLGHGILPETPEENVRLFIRLQREIFK